MVGQSSLVEGCPLDFPVEDAIAAANEARMAMVFTGERHFKH